MISVLMPAYIDNYDKLAWLNQAVNSVLAQKFDQFELILMDDASPVTIALDSGDDERVRKFKMTYRSGPALCRNTAAALARYEALLPVDADDILSPGAMETMYQAWRRDKTLIIYGDLQRLEKVEGQFTPTRVFELPEYTFEKSMDLNGIIPVTAMHSIDCHRKAGGWKADIEAGLEDVEYWIAAGKAGFCGKKIHEVTFLYRKHEESRHSQLRTSKRETEMRNLIRMKHLDVYEGRFPMGCCGGGKAYVPPPVSNSVSAPISLANVPAEQKVWVEYRGARQASFGIVGPFTNHTYMVDGPGHKIEVHINDLSKFQRSGRGADFTIGVKSPNGPAVEVVQSTNAAFKADPPELAQVERLDRIAAG